MNDYYKILEINPNADEFEIKKAYRKLAIMYHPDKHYGDAYFTNKFIELTEAYNALLNSISNQVNQSENNAQSDDETDEKKEDVYEHQNNDQPKEKASSKTEDDYAREKKDNPKENNENIKYQYKSPKAFYSEDDRHTQTTLNTKPFYDFLGNKISENMDFFIVPEVIGKIIEGYSSLLINKKVVTLTEKINNAIPGVLLAIIFSTLIYFLFQPNTIFSVIIFIVPTLISLLVSFSPESSEHINLYVGINGFAEFKCRKSKDILKSIEMNFNFFTDLYVYQSEQRVNFVYQGTDFVFVCLNDKNNGIYYAKNTFFDKNKEIPIEVTFCNRIEHYWTMYLLDKMEMKLENDGYILFSFYSVEKNVYNPYIKLGIGYITFIKNNNEEFTYRFSDIKRIYRKGNDLHIQHLNYQKNLYFFKSGNEDIIPMLYICNRMFFYKAMELLLGYKL